MFNFLKTKLPTGDTKEMVEIESWTLSWYTRGYGYDDNIHHKVFTSEPDAKEYLDKLEKANAFLQTGYTGSPKIIKNS